MQNCAKTSALTHSPFNEECKKSLTRLLNPMSTQVYMSGRGNIVRIYTPYGQPLDTQVRPVLLEWL